MFLISARHKLAVYTLFDAINSGEYGVASLISSMIIVITIAVTGGVSALVLRESRRKEKKRRRGMYLEMKDLSKSFDGKEVVSGLNLSMNQGEILCLLGASGCGKTTTLRMAGGFLEPDRGHIYLDGEDITKLPPERRPVSTVFQSYALFPHMTALQNVMYGLKFQGMKKKEAAERAWEYLEIVGLADRASSSVRNFPAGSSREWLWPALWQ